MPPQSVVVVDVREIVDPARAHERLEPDHAALGEFFHPIEIPRRQSAPEGEIGPAVRLRGRELAGRSSAPSSIGGELFSGMSKKHVPPPAAKAAGAGVEAFPVRRGRAR